MTSSVSSPPIEPGTGTSNTPLETPHHFASSRSEEWDRVVSASHGGLLQSWRWGEFKRLSGWTPRRLALPAPQQASGEAILAQLLFRSVPKLPLPLSIAYIPRGPLHAPNLDPTTEEAFWRTVHSLARK